MTYSIIAKKGKQYGVGTITASIAVGGFVHHALPNQIVSATQGFYTNHLYNYWAEELLKDQKLTQVLNRIIEKDPNSNYRQFILMDKQGNTAGWTGGSNDSFCGHILKKNLAVAGNRLVGRHVLESMVSAYECSKNSDFVEQIIDSLEAGVLAGGDKQGAISIALRVVSEDLPPCDLRVDCSEIGVITDIRKLYSYYTANSYQEFVKSIPTINNPHKAG
ncbi:DUF1028 domain-containing protein [Francisella adeliensis]|uniref:DUF1028 domain-containing protein n=1 Tax=Francisella adeliensis TaxID=2007306 RepID=UPI0013AF814D|nr:DUF1028 domain-containing protein [Francisella adeliensis]MBK2086179.1 DUF1028 domain-containing protein [Francisella adeliensis]MBK2096657.1 DUF1028 domain-containing protein [Francisella adeliensis]